MLMSYLNDCKGTLLIMLTLSDLLISLIKRIFISGKLFEWIEGTASELSKIVNVKGNYHV